MRIETSPEGFPEIHARASLDHPLYLIEPRASHEGNGGLMVLGTQLSSGVLGVGEPTVRHKRKPYAQPDDRKLYFWTDRPNGAAIHAPLRGAANYQADPFGHLNARKGITEMLTFGDGTGVLRVAGHARDADRVTLQVCRFTAQAPLLVVEAITLRCAFPNLADSPTSHFSASRRTDYPQLTPDLGFPQIVDRLREAVRTRGTMLLLLEEPVAQGSA